MRDQLERLHDILEAIERIETHSSKGRAVFERDELIQTWIVHHLQVIGEAAAGLDMKFQDKHPTIPWKEIVGMRNVLVHGYFDVDLDIVWEVVEKELPNLKSEIQRLIDELASSR